MAALNTRSLSDATDSRGCSACEIVVLTRVCVRQHAHTRLMGSLMG